MTSIMVRHFRRSVGRTEIAHVVSLNARALYVKAMERKLTTSASTAEVGLRTCQLGLYLVGKIVEGSPHVHKLLIKIIL